MIKHIYWSQNESATNPIQTNFLEVPLKFKNKTTLENDH